ncbi:MAG: hypothetical protein FWE36_00370 [Erysipelotrichales bacterium]|nr:hypothetical protein [Erysipelotrichales bacterium]
MNKKLKYLLLVLLLIGSIGIIYGFWASGVNNPDNETEEGNINVGAGRDVDTVINVNDQTSNQTLVPVGTSHIAQGTNLVEVIYLTFNVTWTEELGLNAATGTPGILTASLVENSISLNSNVHHLVNISFQAQYDITLGGVAVPVVVRVTLDKPINQTQYLALAGQTFSFQMRFSLVANQSLPSLDDMFQLAFDYIVARINLVIVDDMAIYTDELFTQIFTPGHPQISWTINVVASNPIMWRAGWFMPTVTINGVSRDLDNPLWVYQVLYSEEIFEMHHFSDSMLHVTRNTLTHHQMTGSYERLENLTFGVLYTEPFLIFGWFDSDGILVADMFIYSTSTSVRAFGLQFDRF